MTLRRRLVALIVLVVLTVSSVIAVVLALSLRSNLYGQLDQELRASSARTLARPGFLSDDSALPPLPNGPSAPDLGQTSPNDSLERVPAGQAAGTINVRFFRGLIMDAGFVDESGTYQLLTQEQFDAVTAVPEDGDIHSVDVPGLGPYRAISGADRLGDRAVTAVSSEATKQSLQAFVGLEVLLLVAATALAGGVGWYFIRRALAPLDAVAETATRVSELPLDQGEVGNLDRVPDSLTNETTEVGKVGASLNRLLGHIQSALTSRHESETQVRQFVADASHELRTPLASIRGYAELVRRSDTHVVPETAQALARIESEAVRMTGLVEDMLLLAHLDAGRELAHNTVDMSMLAITTLTDANAAGSEHNWQLDLPSEPCEIIGDEERLQQVLVNLLANARVHTPEGTTVTLALRPQASGQLVVEVSNNGPAIPGELLPNIFQRFTRADSSRARTRGSTGLGLAIVHAIVSAHGGTISVRSSEQLTVFRLTLPGLLPTSTQDSIPPVPYPPSESEPHRIAE